MVLQRCVAFTLMLANLATIGGLTYLNMKYTPEIMTYIETWPSEGTRSWLVFVWGLGSFVVFVGLACLFWPLGMWLCCIECRYENKRWICDNIDEREVTRFDPRDDIRRAD